MSKIDIKKYKEQVAKLQEKASKGIDMPKVKVSDTMKDSWINKVKYIQEYYKDTKITPEAEKSLESFEDFVYRYFSHHTRNADGEQIPMAKFHIDASNYIIDNKQTYSLLELPRGHAKTTVFGLFLPIYLCLKGEVKNVVVVSKSSENATQMLQNIQAELTYNNLLIKDFGVFKSDGDWSKKKFITKNDCMFTSLGRGESPRGLKHKNFRTDFIIVDDIDDDEMSRNVDRVKDTFSWMMQSLLPTTDPIKSKFILVGNRFSHNMVLDLWSKSEGVNHIKVNAIENDEPVWKEYWTLEALESRKKIMGTNYFMREYMNTPSAEGSIFKQEWMIYKRVEEPAKYQKIVLYWDPSYSTSGDYKAISIVGFINNEYHILDTYYRQGTIRTAINWIFDMYDKYKYGNLSMYFEGLFSQALFYMPEIQKVEIEKGYKLPIVADKEQKKEKISRIESMSPYFERLEFFWNRVNETDPDHIRAKNEMLSLSFRNNKNDDFCDSLESAVNKLNQAVRNLGIGYHNFERSNEHSY